MARDNFEAVMDVIFRHEGGFVNHPQDPGGATNMGITKKTLESHLGRPVSVAEVKAMPRRVAREIYRGNYWNAIRGDELPAGLDLVAMDGAVNSGPRRGARWLQIALGVPTDGQIGPVTLAAAQEADAFAIDKAIAAREAFLRGLSTWGTFGKGWSRRLKETREEAHRMASEPDRMPENPAGKVPRMPENSTGLIAALMALFARAFR